MDFTREEAKQKVEQLVNEYDSNEDYYMETDEANIETKLIEPLFESLGWTKKDFEKRQKLTSKTGKRQIPDYVFKLNDRPVFVLEAKKVKVEIETDKDTWRQAISYALSNRIPFAVLSNFRSIRIFCVEQQNTTKNVFRNLRYHKLIEQFNDLWLLSKESFEKNEMLHIAESEQRLKTRITIDKPLLEDIITSRRKIIASLEKNYANKYSTEEKEDIAQRLLGRLIFIRKAEDIGINVDNEGKEIEFLEQITELPDNNTFPKLIKIFQKYEEVFDSELFMQLYDKDLMNIEIEGKIVKEFVKHLYYSRNGELVYNFDWINSDVLGSVYEQYLSNIIKETAKGAKTEESISHRKKEGIYYTPTYIVDYIVRNTLGELIKDKKPSDVDKIRILDPACGSGSFLIKTFDVLNEYYWKADKHYAYNRIDTSDWTEPYTKKIDLLKNNIFGVDLDRKAVEISQLNLLLKIAQKRHRLPLLRENIKCGNSLIDDPTISDKAFTWENEFKQIINDGGFDVVIGNPPYVDARQIEQDYVDYYRAKFKTAGNRINTIPLFIELGIMLLKDKGYLGMIIHKNSIRSNDFIKLRQYILDTCKIRLIISLGAGIFEDVTGETVILILQKTEKNKDRVNNIVFHGDKEILLSKNNSIYTKLPQKIFYKIPGNRFNIFLDERKIAVLDKIKNGCVELKEVAVTKQGIIVGDENKYIQSSKRSAVYKPILRGRNLSRYNAYFDNEYLYYIEGTKVLTRSRDPSIFEKDEKILTQHVSSRIVATLDTDRYYALQTINVVFSKGGISNRYLLAILNSKMMNFYYDSYFNMGSEFTTAVATENLDMLPIKQIPKSQEKLLIELVNHILLINKQLREIGEKRIGERTKIDDEIKKVDYEIDELVYKIYGITENEKKIIEESLK